MTTLLEIVCRISITELMTHHHSTNNLLTTSKEEQILRPSSLVNLTRFRYLDSLIELDPQQGWGEEVVLYFIVLFTYSQLNTQTVPKRVTDNRHSLSIVTKVYMNWWSKLFYSIPSYMDDQHLKWQYTSSTCHNISYIM